MCEDTVYVWRKKGVIWLSSSEDVVISTIIKIDGWFVGIYAISTFIGYLMPNPFLRK